VLGRLADQPRERQQCERREDEQDGRSGIESESRDDDDWREDERCPEDPPRHGASVPPS
jgi:hypothetical protein